MFKRVQPSYRAGLALIYLVHLCVLGLFFFVIPSQWHHGWYFHHGGDQEGYYALAESLVEGQPVASKFPLGFPLLLAPAIMLTQPAGWEDLVPPFVVLHAFVLHGLSQVLLGAIARRVTHSRALALLVVLGWVLTPLALYAAVSVAHSQQLAANWAVHLPWLQMLSDPPAAFLTLLVIWIWFKGFDSGRLGWVGVAGLLSGFLGLVRFSGLLTPGLLGLVMLYKRRWRELAIFGAATALTFAPQLVYNAHFWGGPLTFGYVTTEEDPGRQLFSASYFADGASLLAGRPAALIVVAAGIMIAALGWAWLWRRDRLGAVIVGGWALSYAAFYGAYYYSWVGGMTRFLIPAYPAGVITLAACAALGWRVLFSRSSRRRKARRG
jgi:hypothetical protein